MNEINNPENIKSKIYNILQVNEIECLSDVINLQTEINIEISNFLRKSLDEYNLPEKIDENIPTIYTFDLISNDPTPFDQKAEIQLYDKDIEDILLLLKYENDYNYVVRKKYYELALKEINNAPLNTEELISVDRFCNIIKDRENSSNPVTEIELESINNLLGCNGLENGKMLLNFEEYLKLVDSFSSSSKNISDEGCRTEESVEAELVMEDENEYDLQSVINNDIYICEMVHPTRKITKIVITGYNYNKWDLELKIIENITNGNLKEWVENHKTNLNKFPELRDKLVLRHLTYEEYLTIDGWKDSTVKNVEDSWFPEIIKVEEPKSDLIIAPYQPIEIIPKPTFNLTPHQQEKFDGLIQKIDDILKLQSSLTRPPVPAYFMTVLEGAAGTGKTTMMKKVLEKLIDDGRTVVFCSPTHQALGVIRETLRETDLEFTENVDEFMLDECPLILKTLASFLGIKMNRDLENGSESFEPDPRAPKLCCDILAIDESSMISKSQLSIIIQKLHIQVKCVLFIGDEVQLDSPADNNESNGIFNIPQKFALEEVVRQAADNKILQFAWELREHIKTKQCFIPPSLLLNPNRINENILIFNNQQDFLNHYFQNESDDKLVSTYTNKIANEYNTYIRQMKLIGQGGKPLNYLIDPNEPDRKFINSWDEYKEFYIGEQLVIGEPNQKNGEILHQTGERIIIQKLEEKEFSIFISIQDSTDLLALPENKEFKVRYFELIDENHKMVNVIRHEDIQLYNEILGHLSIEAKKTAGKRAWAKYWSVREKFTKVNKTFAFTLHKLQGSTCENIYIDARDLDKFFKSMAIGVYKLIYIALTRPKQQVIFLV